MYNKLKFIQNNDNISIQIIYNKKEYLKFLKKDQFRRCLIEDLVNFNAWKKGEAPYNQENMSFAIWNNLYEAFTK